MSDRTRAKQQLARGIKRVLSAARAHSGSVNVRGRSQIVVSRNIGSRSVAHAAVSRQDDPIVQGPPAAEATRDVPGEHAERARSA